MAWRTTIRLDDDLLREAKKRAAQAGMTLTALIEDSLMRERLYRVEDRSRHAEPVRLRTAGRGGIRPGVDLDDSASLLDAMDDRL